MIIPRSTARRGPLFFLLVTCLIVIILLHRSRLLIGLLFEDGSPDLINPEILLDHWDADLNGAHPAPLIPKIIHQTYINDSVPERWHKGQNVTTRLHPDYEYKFWTDESAHTFIATHYPDFLPTYDSYPYAIQRVDALRYFLLAHFGGIYLDLDIEPSHRLDPLLSYAAFACRTAPTGISNDAIGARPGHPFYMQVTHSLQTYNRNWLLPYITIMYSTGPLFLSVMWRQYLHEAPLALDTEDELSKIWVLIRGTKHKDTYGFFYNNEGGSWHGKDMAVIFWMGQHWFVVTLLGFVVGFALLTGSWWAVKWITEKGGMGDYRRLSRSA